MLRCDICFWEDRNIFKSHPYFVSMALQLAGAMKERLSRACLARYCLSEPSSKLKAMLLFGHTGDCLRRFRAAAAGNWSFAWRKQGLIQLPVGGMKLGLAE